MTVRQDFLLERGQGRYTRAIPESWCFGERAFGGYTAAVALSALLTDLGRDTLASASIQFLEAGRVGPVEVVITPLRAGRTATAAQALVTQEHKPILLATAWVADAWHDTAAAPATAPFADLTSDDGRALGPDDGASLSWMTDMWPALRFADRRAIDYPTSWDAFARGTGSVALWARIADEADTTDTTDRADVDPLPYAQLGDVLHLDAHLFDAPGQFTGFDDASLLSLDLSIAWQPGAGAYPSPAWRRLDARGSVADGGVTSYASVRAQDGALLAIATSQGLLRHTR